MRMILDFSSIVGKFVHIAGDDYEEIELDGKVFKIPDPEEALENFQQSFLNTLRTYEIQTTDVVAVLDPDKPQKMKSARERLYPEYGKTKRSPVPREFFICRKELFRLAKDWLLSQGAIFATPKTKPFLVADDLVNDLACRLPGSLIYSGDKDMLSCPGVVLFHGPKGIEVDPEKFPVPKEFIHTYRVIVTGDASDNISSVKGFGPKTWEKMIDKFGEDSVSDLTDMIKNQTLNEDLADLVPKFPAFKKILDQEEQVYLMYSLIEFFPIRVHEIKWEGGMLKGSDTLVTASNYDQVLREIKDIDVDHYTIDYETDVCDRSREWSKTSGVKVDVVASKITGMGLRVGSNNYYFCVDHKDTNNITLSQLEDVLESLWGTRILAHNAGGFEHPVTYSHFGAMLPEMVDTAILANYVDENDFVHLKGLSKKWLGYQQATYEETLKGRSGMREVTGAEVVSYGIDDVVCTDALYNLFKLICECEGTWETFKEVEIPSIAFTGLSFINGVEFDAARHQELQDANNKKIEATWEKLNEKLLVLRWVGGEFVPLKGRSAYTFNRLYETVHGVNPKVTSLAEGTKKYPDSPVTKAFENEIVNRLYEEHWEPKAEFNVRSPTQMTKLLYDTLGMPVRIRNKPTDKMKKAGKQGSPAANEEAIKNAIVFKDVTGDKKEVLELLLEYKGYLTKESLFFEKYPKFVHWKTGRIHGSMRQSSTTTRRFSHTAPNYAQLPKKKGKEVRDMMTAPDGWYLCAIDIDSQELKLQAWETQDASFLSCYTGTTRKDVHALTGYQVALKQGVTRFKSYHEFEKLLATDAKPFRVSGKATNFASAYLCMAKRLAHMLCVTEKTAQEFLDAKALAFPGLMPAVDEYLKKCRKRKYSTTFMGARRHLHGRKHYGSKNDYNRGAADRLAWSFKIQSSGAEQIKLAAGRMVKRGLFSDGLCFPVTIIHDELVLYIHESVLDERVQAAHDCVCTQYADMELEVSSTPEVGKSLGSLKEWKNEGR